MTKKRLVIYSIICLAFVGSFYFGKKMAETNWLDLRPELALIISDSFLKTGAPNKRIADLTAACVAEIIVNAVHEAGCSPDELNIVDSLQQCLDNDEQLELAIAMTIPDCVNSFE